jgi:hypothetical protein
MNNQQRSDYLTRDRIMNLLSDEENAKVSTAETAKHLATGEEYIDLTQLEKGVLIASLKATLPLNNVLPKNAVHAQTWLNIVAALPMAHKTVPKGKPDANFHTKRSAQ